ncbi:hypothetical protein ACFL30_01305 [Candidatus Latescibacterota bacterium]
MKSRILLPLLLLLIVIVIGGYFTVSQFLQVNQKARLYFLDKTSEFLGGDFDAASVFILPWSISIKDAHLSMKDTPVRITINRIRIKISLIEFIKNRFKPIYGIEQIYFDRPEFLVISDMGDTTAKKMDYEKLPVINIEKIPQSRININKGSLVLQRESERFILADNISGWTESTNVSDIQMYVEGNVLSDSKNTFLTGTLQLESNSFSVDITSNKCDISYEKLGLMSEERKVVPLQGMLDFTAKLVQKNDELALSGNFVLEQGVFELGDYGIDVNDVYVTGIMSDKELQFDSISASILNIKPELSGRLSLVPEPALKLDIRVRDIDLSSVLDELYPEKDNSLSGNIDLDAVFEGKPGMIFADTEIKTDSIHFENRLIQDFAAHLHLDGRKLAIKNITGIYDKYLVTAQGTGSFNPNAEKEYLLDITISDRSLEKNNVTIQLDGSADFGKELYIADVKLKRTIPGFSHFYDFSGTCSLDHDTLDFSLENDYIELKGNAGHLFEKAEIASTIRCKKLPLLNYFSHADSSLVIDGTGNLAGTSDNLTFDGDLLLNAYDKLSAQVRGKASARDILKKSRRVEVDAQLTNLLVNHSQPTSMTFNAVMDSSGVTLKAVDGDGASLSVAADISSGDLNGHLDLDEFPLERIIDIFRREEFGEKARLTGRADIRGTVRDPYFITPEHIQAADLKIGGLDRLTGIVKVNGSFGELTFSDIHIKRDGINVIDAFGTWVTGKPFILNLEGKQVQFGAISDIISKTRVSDGIADYSVSTVFYRKSGTIEGSFTLRDGHFYDIPIDEASGNMSGGSTGFIVTDFTVHKEGLYTGKGGATSGYLWKDETETPGLSLNLFVQGELLKVLPRLTGSIKKASGKSQLDILMGGTWQDPIVLEAELNVSGGTLEPAVLVDKITDITAVLKIEPEAETRSGYRGVRVRVGNGVVNNKKLIVRNILSGDEGWEAIQTPGLISVVNNDVNLDFGVLTGRIEKLGSRDRDNALEIHIPGFMKENETGQFELSGKSDGNFFIGASPSDDSLTPYISGTILARSGELTYPLLNVSSDSGSAGFTKDIFWDLDIIAGSSVYYFNEVNQKWQFFGTTVSRTFTKIEDSSSFKVMGRLSDGSFRVTGNARSTSGTVSYFGADFDIERIEFELDSSREDRPSDLIGRARTIVTDSTGVQTEIFLKVDTDDRNTEQVRETAGRVEATDYGGVRRFDVKGLGTIRIEFSSTDPSDDTQDKILAKLGISSDNFGSAAARALTSGFDSYYADKLVRPFEDLLKKYTKLDVFKITPSVIGNIMKSQLGFTNRFAPESDYRLFDETRILLGESLFSEWFLSYRGQYGLSRDFLSRRERGFFHEIGLQYNLKRNTRLHLKYFYDDVLKEGEKRFEIRHDFEF